MLSSLEAAAHLTIIETLRRRQLGLISQGVALFMTKSPLEQYRPRCNCGRVLDVSPYVYGMRAFRCGCGANWRECA